MDQDNIQTRPPEPITITVLRARNLKGTKADSVQVMVKVEFGEKTLGDSPKVECSPEVPAELNFSTTINCTYDDPLALDEIAHKPVVLTVIEGLPKEKKQKEEKTALLGQCTVDLLPLVKGETKHKYTLVVNPLPGSPLEGIPPEHAKPELDVVVSVNEPLMDSPQVSSGNLMTITMESLLSPPESWTLAGSQYCYAAALPIPVTAEKEAPIIFAGGALKPGADKEIPNKQKKWAMPGSAQGNAIYIPDSFVSSDSIEDEDGELRAKEDRDHRMNSESEKLRVPWNTERRCYMENSAVKSFQDKIAKCRYWPVEIMRLPPPAANKGKKHAASDEEGSISYHGVAYINLAPLLYPGVKRIRGAYRVHAYTDHALHEKTKRKTGYGEEAGRIAFNILNRNSASPFPKKAGKEKDEKKEKEVKKGRSMSIASQHHGGHTLNPPEDYSVSAKSEMGSHMASQTIKSDTGSEVDGQAPVNVEGQQYVDSKSYIMLEISLTSPLIPKRPPEELARRVAEYIPPRPLFPKRTDGAQRSVEDFHNQVASVANLILDEFRDQFGDELKTEEPQSNESMETRRQKLIYELNSSGKYFAFKEQLKHAVVKIVREKYLKTTTFDNRQELQTFLSELYVYLIDQMHVALGRSLALEDQPPVPTPLTDSAQLKHFAREAEVNENFELATKYYQERIARNKNDPTNWFEYGTFCLYINDITKAEECFKECIAIDQKHLQGLLLYGVVCTLLEKHEAAETFFEAATCVDPRSILAWTMLGLFYDTVNNEIGAEMAYIEANKLNQAAAWSSVRQQREEEMAKDKKDMDVTGEELEAPHPGDQGGLAPPPAVATETKQPSPPSSDKPPTSARSGGGRSMSDRRQSATRRSEPHLHPDNSGTGSKLKSDSSMSRPGSQLKLGSQRGTPQPADDTQEEQPPREPTPIPKCSVYMQAIDWLLEVKAVPFTERALAHELLTPTGGPTSDYHICYARLKLQKKEFNDAEESLTEALQFDHQNPDAWALLGHVKYMTGDTNNARDCYERTISFVSDASEMHSIYLRLASIYLQDRKFEDAKNTFLLACKRSPSCVSWLGVGIACYRLDELSEAEDALSEANILNNTDPEVWAYLSLVCLKTGRQLESEQAYKYALKVNLQDQELLAEIQEVQQAVGFGNPEF
ncbi:cilia- and flagella-associated protein 70-like isoform X5 [Pecten maximus]|uniref:cilia- and flagella-associated protein 70-like isoform X5 n=1 Tax=Pecten maximus TaxID=6579 RepID=UPI001458D95D|nr:cilia- and flagella-associated protein 70-like isoform X5 [Pecten maximus]